MAGARAVGVVRLLAELLLLLLAPACCWTFKHTVMKIM